MPSLVKDSFALNLLILRWAGLYSRKGDGFWYRIYAWAICLIFAAPLPVFALAFFLLDDSVDLNQLTENAFSLVEAAVYLPKMWPFLYWAHEVTRFIDGLHCPVFNRIKPRQEILVQEGVRICTIVSRVMVLSVFASVVTWITTPIIMVKASWPIMVWTPFHVEYGTVVFYVIYFLISFGVVITGPANLALDTLLTGLAHQATIQLRILKDNLVHVYEDTEEVASIDQDKDSLIYQNISQCIVHYDAILQFVANYQKFFSVGMVWQLAGSMLVISIATFKVMEYEPLSVPFFSMLVFLLTMLNEVYIFCIFGNILHTESSEVTTLAYLGKWYKYDAKSKKALLILMERAQRPIMVTVGGILDLSLETFTTLIRRIISVLTALQNLKEIKK